MADHPRWSTAVHEAAHAVASHSLGRGIRKVTIVPNSDSGGHVENHRRRGWSERMELVEYEVAPGGFIEGRLRRAVEVEVIISLAGGLAETEFLGIENHEVGMGLVKLRPAASAAMAAKYGGKAEDFETLVTGGDYRYVIDILDRVSGSDEEASAYLEWLQCRTLNLLRSESFRSKVEAVARVLCEQETLTGRAIGAVIDQVQSDEYASARAAWHGRFSTVTE